jgi:site-specific recombinase XerD
MGGKSVVAAGNETTVAVMSRQADSDEHVLQLWLDGRSRHTVRAYGNDAREFLCHVGKPLALVTVGDVQDYGASAKHLSTASRARKLSVVKSLLTFAHRIGYLPFNVGAPVKLPAIKSTLAERILSEADVHRMLALEPDVRNRAFLTLLYAAGLRISEACGLTWRDVQPRDQGGQITVFGKGGKTRAVLLPPSVWRAVAELRNGASADDPVFASRTGGHLDASAGLRIVKSAAKRAGLGDNISPHWLRHAHASHSLDRGAPIHLVQATLGHASVATTGRYLHARPAESSARYLAV